jgi:stearoyl-CoA desaturase (delta-9 desaturase)
MFRNIPFERVNWVSSIFLIGTFLLTITAVPYYLYTYGWDWFLFGLFLTLFVAAGLSITVGYHRLFSHQAFKASFPVRLMTLIFGAAAFENSILEWASDHRNHHKHVDTDDDPYDISKGFLFAHIGWILFKLENEAPMDNVNDLRKDPLVMWQHRWVHVIAMTIGFALPTLIGYLYAVYLTDGAVTAWQGTLGGFLIGGVARVTCVQHCTFFINSLCHMMGKQPYSSKCTARDHWFMAIFTFGEGYHNYHHEFQWDYRNAVKYWQIDPTKWIIWTLSKIGLARDLRRVSSEKILLAEAREAQYRYATQIPGFESDGFVGELSWDKALNSLKEFEERIMEIYEELREAVQDKLALSKATLRSLRPELRKALAHLDYLTDLQGSLARQVAAG